MGSPNPPIRTQRIPVQVGEFRTPTQELFDQISKLLADREEPEVPKLRRGRVTFELPESLKLVTGLGERIRETGKTDVSRGEVATALATLPAIPARELRQRTIGKTEIETGSLVGDIAADIATDPLTFAAFGLPSLTRSAGRKTLSSVATEFHTQLRGGGQAATKSQKFLNRFQRFQREFTSEFTPLRAAERSIYKQAGITLPRLDLARKFEQIKGAAGKAQADVIDFREALQSVRGLEEELDAYMFWRRTKDRLTTDPVLKRVGDFTLEDANRQLSKQKEELGEEVFGRIETFAEGTYQKAMEDTLRLQLMSGRLSEETFNRIIGSRDFYAPFRVLQAAEEHQALAAGRNIENLDTIAKRIVGIKRPDFQIDSIIHQSEAQIYRSRLLAEKNLKMLELDKLADLDKAGSILRRVKPTTVFRETPEGKALRVAPGSVARGTKQIGKRPRPGFDVVNYYKDGKLQALEVRQEIADAIHGMTRGEADAVGKMASMAGGLLRGGATAFNLAFQFNNLFLADLPRAALVSRYGIKNYKDLYHFPRDFIYAAYTSVFGNFGRPNELYKEFLRSGAMGSDVQSFLTPGLVGIHTPGIPATAARHAKNVVSSIPRFGKAIEETNKILGFKRALDIENIASLPADKRQRVMEEIVTEVRNFSGSPDFSRRGTISSARDLSSLNLLFMFFNARVQGVASDFARLAGTAEGGGRAAMEAWIKLTGAVGIPALSLALYNNSPAMREDFDKIPSWEKENYFMIPTSRFFTNSRGETVRDYWKVQKREIVKLFGNLVETSVRYAYDQDPEGVKAFALNFLENISPVNIESRENELFNLERLESVGSSLNPLIRAPLELGSGRDFFRKRPVVPEFIRIGGKSVKSSTLEPEQQFTRRTPEVFVKTGQALGVSPLVVQQAVRSVTAGGITQVFPERAQEDRPEALRTALETPVVGGITRRFVRSDFTEGDRSRIQELEKDLMDQGTEKAYLLRRAEEVVQQQVDLTQEQKFQQIQEIKKEDPKLAKAVLEMEALKTRNLSVADRMMMQLQVGNGARARRIVKDLKAMTPEEQLEYRKELREKGILSDRVAKQVNILMRQ